MLIQLKNLCRYTFVMLTNVSGVTIVSRLYQNDNW